MATTLAQANPTTGASNAADFQPGTQNPQTAGSTQLFSQNGELQNGSQESLLESSKAQISVPSNPAPAGQGVTTAKANNIFPVLAIVLAAAIALVLLYRRRKTTVVTQAPVVVPEVVPVVKAKPVVKAAAPKPATKKAVPKKSKSQRKKRARR